MGLWNEPFVETETVKITAAVRVISFPRRYHPGQGDLWVFLNGMFAVKDVDYREVTPYSIEFTEDLSPEDVVVGQFQRMW
jgi:hypothetical protein